MRVHARVTLHISRPGKYEAWRGDHTRRARKAHSSIKCPRHFIGRLAIPASLLAGSPQIPALSGPTLGPSPDSRELTLGPAKKPGGRLRYLSQFRGFP